MLTIVCIRVGDKYGPEYVQKLKNMVERHLTVPHRFLCITDDPMSLEGIDCIDPEGEGEGWWTKLSLFKENPYGLKDKFLFLDLDVVIRDNIDCFVQRTADFTIMQDLLLPMYNSSCFLLTPGSRRYVWDSYEQDPESARRISTGGDQHWITLKAKGEVWPSSWIKSYKVNNFKEEGKIVIFHGRPNPHECDGWVKKEWV